MQSVYIIKLSATQNMYNSVSITWIWLGYMKTSLSCSQSIWPCMTGSWTWLWFDCNSPRNSVVSLWLLRTQVNWSTFHNSLSLTFLNLHESRLPPWMPHFCQHAASCHHVSFNRICPLYKLRFLYKGNFLIWATLYTCEHTHNLTCCIQR